MNDVSTQQLSPHHSTHSRWHGYWPFVWGATGAAVSLINFWRFPYLVGEHGGGLFLLVYLLCVVVLAVPIMLAEVLIGRLGRGNPVAAVAAVARGSGVSIRWRLVGYLVIVASLLILPIYSVMGGWGLEYLQLAHQQQFAGLTEATSNARFDRFLLDQTTMLKWHSLLIAVSVLVVALGLRLLSWVVKLLVPAMFVGMLGLLVPVVEFDSFARSFDWMFSMRWQQFGWNSLMMALGHGFLTLGVGLGVMMSYSAYLPRESQMGRLVLRIGALDLFMAVLAGLVTLSLVFALPGMEPSAGPESLFVRLPVVFAQMADGHQLAVWFYGIITLVALSSTIPLMEPFVAHLQDRGWARPQAAVLAGTIAWALGIGVLASFNQWQQVELLLGMDFSQLLDYLVANILMPTVGLLMAVMVGWLLPESMVREGFKRESKFRFNGWLLLLKYVAPILIYIIFFLPVIQRMLS